MIGIHIVVSGSKCVLVVDVDDDVDELKIREEFVTVCFDLKKN